jgi:subtilisin family serine protease
MLANDGTNLYGTSFAAPQVSAYAAIIGSKFTTATPLQITDQLLDTARTDTIQGYDVAIHGQGEASLSRALAPQSIN